jgi:hypothetical protein
MKEYKEKSSHEKTTQQRTAIISTMKISTIQLAGQMRKRRKIAAKITVSS